MHLELGQSRLLEVDNRVVLPAKSHTHFIVTSVDVPHSWVVPSLRVKCDVILRPLFRYNEKEFTMVSVVRFVELPS
uniref:Cytochrome c oxidase polypeptide II n=1 Tax=Solanum tuberosum TaxID=4113 RepID=M1BTU1_SOLTU